MIFVFQPVCWLRHKVGSIVCISISLQWLISEQIVGPSFYFCSPIKLYLVGILNVTREHKFLPAISVCFFLILNLNLHFEFSVELLTKLNLMYE